MVDGNFSLKPIDIFVMKKLSEIANVVPVLAKSDSLTIEERTAFKNRIKQEIEFHGIQVFPYIDNELDEGNEQDRAEKEMAMTIRDMLPFAIVGSERNIVINGKAVRGRRTRWGMVNGNKFLSFFLFFLVCIFKYSVVTNFLLFFSGLFYLLSLYVYLHIIKYI